MRIFQLLSAPATYGIGQSKIWLRNLHEPLIDIGHEVFLYQFDWSIGKPIDEDLLRIFCEENKKKHFDLFFAYVQDGMLKPETIQNIKQLGTLTCNFSCNNTHQFNLVENISTFFDYNLYSEKEAGNKFKGIGANGIWFPMAANPNYYKPINVSRDVDVSFIGQEYAKRYIYIWFLLQNGINVHVYGPGWRKYSDRSSTRKLLSRAKLSFRSLFAYSYSEKATRSAILAHNDFLEFMCDEFPSNFHLSLSDDQMIRTFNESKINLGFLEVYEGHNILGILKQHLHLREFEVPMCGALYFTGNIPELEEFYEPDKEIVTYRNEYELLDKITFFLNHPESAEKIRQAGYRRAINCHSYQKRFQDLFAEIYHE